MHGKSPSQTRQAPDSIESGDAPPAAGAGEPGRVRFVLMEPSHCGNIGAAARAIRTMGFHDLRVVEPRDPGYRIAAEAVALAANAVAVLHESGSHSTLIDALDGVTLAFAMTGYAREFGPPHLPLREAALQAASWLGQGQGPVAFVFGTERTGLTNHDVLRCHYSCAIPADARLGSLNLAQAVQVTAYEMRCALAAPADLQTPAPPRRAPVEMIERLFVSLEQALTAIGFHDPQVPKHSLARLRSLFARAGLSVSEVELLIGICAAMVEPKRLRAGRGRNPPLSSLRDRGDPERAFPSAASRERGRGEGDR
jgi:tRNA/rRNA methyltransferase